MVVSVSFFFFNDTATTEIYTLSLHDALPISGTPEAMLDRLALNPNRIDGIAAGLRQVAGLPDPIGEVLRDRKSTRLNSSHANISYAVFCLKKKKITHPLHRL